MLLREGGVQVPYFDREVRIGVSKKETERARGRGGRNASFSRKHVRFHSFFKFAT